MMLSDELEEKTRWVLLDQSINQEINEKIHQKVCHDKKEKRYRQK